MANLISYVMILLTLIMEVTSLSLPRLNLLLFIMSKGFYFIGLVLFCLPFCLGSCTTLHGTADGKSVIVRNDTIKVQYGGSVSKSY